MFDILLVAITAALATAHAVALVNVLLTRRRVVVLAELPEPVPREWPRLSVITPARNEAAVIETALCSALDADYPNLELVAVDDRSTDGTGAIIDSLAAADDRVRAVHVRELPNGWLGKLNALQRGVEASTGDWLLLADADTHYASGALRRAVALAEEHKRDLVTAYPELTMRAFFADTVFAAAPVLGHLQMPFFRVTDPRSKAFAGLGAFILVRRAALDASPGLEWLRLEVADDMGLGLLIKSHGGSIEVVNGRGTIFIEFYSSFREMVVRMQKNWWAIVARFSVLRALGLATVLIATALAPLLACVPSLPFSVRVLAAMGGALHIAGSVVFNRWVARPLVPTLFPQVGLLLCAFMQVRAAAIGARIGGVEWRGTVYRKEELLPMQRVRI